MQGRVSPMTIVTICLGCVHLLTDAVEAGKSTDLPRLEEPSKVETRDDGKQMEPSTGQEARYYLKLQEVLPS
jgi:hypothetical protein